MNSDIFIDWIQFEFPFAVPNRLLLVFDSACSHISKKVKEYLHARKILFAVIPGGLTGLMQPADVCWFKNVKDSISREIDNWKSSGEFEHTRSGRVKPPTNAMMSSWLSRGWNSLEASYVAQSFQTCFLADICDLHISKHETYGDRFIAMNSEESVEEPNVEESEESGPEYIEDE